ncbi:retrotransposable element ORF2 protein [Nymphaea thermarum]|nr:retrotransposable element ORF2 protein [Nymphaea thermarum]
MAHEVLNSMAAHYAPSACCQLDLSKAYDRVNWNFLKNSLLSMGFHDIWIARIMTCVSTASIAISVNGVVGQYFNSSRGLRQGDPMSPLLFTVIMECLYRRILHSVNTKKLSGTTLPRVGKAPVELFFADDIIFFPPLKLEYLQEIKSIMADFETKAGMRVNDEKSRLVTFNAQEDVSNMAVAFTGWPLGSDPLNYLGLPLFVGKLSFQLCQPLVLKVQRKLASWKASLLSYAGRPKWEGGVGLRSIVDLNRACLGKLALQVGHATSHWASLVSKKYLRNHSLWTRKGKAKDSWLWKGIEWGWDAIRKEVRWSMGNGFTARAWLEV